MERRGIMKNRLVLVFGIMTLLWACTEPQKSPSTSPQPEKVSLRLSWLPNVEFAGVLIAKERGFYKDAGIDLTINPGGQGLDPIQLIAGGSDDVGIAEGSQILIGRSKNIPLKAV